MTWREFGDAIDRDVPDNTAKAIKPLHIRGLLRRIWGAFRQRPLHLLDFIPDAEHAAIRAYKSTYDCRPALLASVAALPPFGGTIHVGPGQYKISDTLHLKKRIHLRGEGGGQAGQPTTLLQFAPDRAGIVFHRHNTGPNGIEASGTESDGSIIEGCAIYGSGTDPTGHGIWMRARATVRDCVVGGFPGNGVQIVAAFNGDDNYMGNANNWQMERVRISNCGGHGLFVDGADANAGVAMAVDVSLNKGLGIYDSSFLGNTFIGCHAAHNTLGPYKTDNLNSRSIFLGCYSESSPSPPSSFSQSTLAIGGLHAGGAEGGLRLLDNIFSPINVNATSGGSRGLGVKLGSGAFIEFGVAGSGAWAFLWNEKLGTIELRYARSDSFIPLRLTTQLSTLTREDGTPIGPGQLVMNGAWAQHASTQGGHRWVGFHDLSQRLAELEARVTALETT